MKTKAPMREETVSWYEESAKKDTALLKVSSYDEQRLLWRKAVTHEVPFIYLIA